MQQKKLHNVIILCDNYLETFRNNSENISFENGKYENDDLIPGKYEIFNDINSDKKLDVNSEEYSKHDNVKLCTYNKIFVKYFELDIEKRNFIIISDDDKDTSD